jgi:hypothetical protein
MVSHQIKYTLKTDNGSYLVEATDLPITKVVSILLWCTVCKVRLRECPLWISTHR